VSVLDKAIAIASPRWAAKRQASRLQLQQLEAVGQAARRSNDRRTRRRGDDWRINDTSLRRYEAQQGKPISRVDRQRIREIFETNPFAVKAKASLLNNLVGYGITGTVKGPKALQKAWTDWIRVCDFDGVLDLYGLQALIAEIWLDDGEAFIVKRIVPGAAVHPLRLQVLDADQLDVTAVLGNSRIRDGIEYGEGGKPVAYHFKRSREIDQFGDPVRVPADQVIHLFHRRRAGQWRGRPHFEPVLDALADVDDFIEAEGIRKKIESCFVGFRSVTNEEMAGGGDGSMGQIEPGLQPLDGDGFPLETFSPGMIINGRDGESMTFGEPKAAGGFAEFMRWGALRIAAGGQTTYERATGDLSNVNYSSFRAGDLEFQRFIGRVQWLMFIPRLLVDIERAFLEAAQLIGLVSPSRSAPVFKWTPPPFGSVDPKKDADARKAEMAMGAESLRNVVAERGYDLDELSDEIAADLKMLEGKGLLALAKAMFAMAGAGAAAGSGAPASAEPGAEPPAE
jgi:lambda family phage portal protein